MKNLIPIFLFLFIWNLATSQAPEFIKYQSLIVNPQGQILVNHEVLVRFTFLSPSPPYTIYEESHLTRTKADGILEVKIGNGQPILGILGNFTKIDWGLSQMRLVTEISFDDGASYSIRNESSINAVPYSLIAKNVVNNEDDDADPLNELELPTNVEEGSLAFFKDGNWLLRPPGSEGEVLKIIEGQPHWIENEIGGICPDPERYLIRIFNGGNDLFETVSYIQFLTGMDLQDAYDLIVNVPSVLLYDVNSCDANIVQARLDLLGVTSQIIKI